MKGIRVFLYLPEGNSEDLCNEMKKSPPVSLKTMYLFLAIAMHQDRGIMDLTIRTLSYLFPRPSIKLDRWADVNIKYLQIEPRLKKNKLIGTCPEQFLVEELLVINLLILGHSGMHGPTGLSTSDSSIWETSNATLVAWAVSVGLHKGIKWSVRMSKQIAVCEELLETRLTEHRKNPDQVFKRYWAGVNIPKALGDLAETLHGSILVDADLTVQVDRYLPGAAPRGGTCWSSVDSRTLWHSRTHRDVKSNSIWATALAVSVGLHMTDHGRPRLQHPRPNHLGPKNRSKRSFVDPFGYQSHDEAEVNYERTISNPQLSQAGVEE
ncbi:hypothetical protein BGZ83_004500 [Gryganskiella cystojenkinii]|nr:hypothetical protein BGZ83_004500 [Gryganskiella cystojenkinii]